MYENISITNLEYELLAVYILKPSLRTYLLLTWSMSCLLFTYWTKRTSLESSRLFRSHSVSSPGRNCTQLQARFFVHPTLDPEIFCLDPEKLSLDPKILSLDSKYFAWIRKYFAWIRKYFLWIRKYFAWIRKYFAWIRKYNLWIGKYFAWIRIYFAWIRKYFLWIRIGI